MPVSYFVLLRGASANVIPEQHFVPFAALSFQEWRGMAPVSVKAAPAIVTMAVAIVVAATAVLVVVTEVTAVVTATGAVVFALVAAAAVRMVSTRMGAEALLVLTNLAVTKEIL